MESISIETSAILGDAESMNAVISERRKGLMSLRKSLAPWLFYDDAGSAVFEEITTLPEYCVSRLERKILHSGSRSDHRCNAALGHSLGSWSWELTAPV
jgi:uncharacterized SAM-dependent methyltransferase